MCTVLLKRGIQLSSQPCHLWGEIGGGEGGWKEEFNLVPNPVISGVMGGRGEKSSV